MKLTPQARIEGILFFKSQPVSYQDLAAWTDIPLGQIPEILKALELQLEHHGMVLVHHDTMVELCTHPDMSGDIQKIQKEELEKPLSRASIETLAMIAYHPGITRAEIEYVRGVNSQFILRALEIRGLIEKKTQDDDKRIAKYHPTLDFLKSLGISTIQELPDFESFHHQLSVLQTESHEENTA